MDPVVWFFVLGLIAGFARSDLRIPPAIYELLSIVLLLSIGLKGGVELARSPFDGIALQAGAVILLGLLIPFFVFPLAYYVARLKRPDAASVAAHYGSVSVATYAVGVSYLGTRGVFYDSQLPLFLVLLEIPAIVIGIVLARGISARTRWSSLAHEILFGKSIVLLVGGLFIGWVAGPGGIGSLEPLFFDLFKGVLAVFLLEMGLIASSQTRELRSRALSILATGLLLPVPLAFAGALLGTVLGLSVGGTMLLAVLSGSASYIAAPAAMRIAVPDANPSISLTASLGVTFPFNVFFGVPLYLQMAEWLHS